MKTKKLLGLKMIEAGLLARVGVPTAMLTIDGKDTLEVWHREELNRGLGHLVAKHGFDLVGDAVPIMQEFGNLFVPDLGAIALKVRELELDPPDTQGLGFALCLCEDLERGKHGKFTGLDGSKSPLIESFEGGLDLLAKNVGVGPLSEEIAISLLKKILEEDLPIEPQPVKVVTRGPSILDILSALLG